MSFLFSGIFAALFALILELTLGSIPGFDYTGMRTDINDPAILTPLTLALFALIEETMKYSVLWKVSLIERKVRLFPSGTMLFALGFGATELLLASSKFPDAAMPALSGMFVLHLFTILLYGFMLGKHPSKKIFVIGILIFGTAIHLAYNISR